jgi:cell division septal protein FtsQ
MITQKKSKKSLQDFLVHRKKDDTHPKSWKAGAGSYGKKTRKEPAWLKSLKKQFIFLAPKKKGKSYLSRSEKRKKYGLFVLKSFSVLACIVLAVIVMSTPVKQFAYSLEFFKIKEIDIVGCSVTKPNEIRIAAGLDYNMSQFSISPQEVSNRLVQYPWVKSARVTRVWPDGVTIQISENKAQALMVTGISGQEKMVYIDAQGNILAQVKPGEELDFPVVTGAVNLEDYEREEFLADTLTFLKLISYNNPNLPAQSVSEIHLDQHEGLVIRLVDFPFPIYFGKGDVKKKYRQLRNVLAVLYKKRKNNVDISQVEYIRMDYINNKVLVAQSNSG